MQVVRVEHLSEPPLGCVIDLHVRLGDRPIGTCVRSIRFRSLFGLARGERPTVLARQIFHPPCHTRTYRHICVGNKAISAHRRVVGLGS